MKTAQSASPTGLPGLQALAPVGRECADVTGAPGHPRADTPESGQPATHLDPALGPVLTADLHLRHAEAPAAADLPPLPTVLGETLTGLLAATPAERVAMLRTLIAQGPDALPNLFIHLDRWAAPLELAALPEGVLTAVGQALAATGPGPHFASFLAEVLPQRSPLDFRDFWLGLFTHGQNTGLERDVARQLISSAPTGTTAHPRPVAPLPTDFALKMRNMLNFCRTSSGTEKALPAIRATVAQWADALFKAGRPEAWLACQAELT